MVYVPLEYTLSSSSLILKHSKNILIYATLLKNSLILAHKPAIFLQRQSIWSSLLLHKLTLVFKTFLVTPD